MLTIDSAKEQICEIGRRLYSKNFVAANEGNLSIRINDGQIVCTPTLICKGYMQPDDLCVVNIVGHQIAGKRKPTSEILLHLEIYRQRSDINSIVHCHPPHATAFAIAGKPVPSGILPEPDIFLGEVPMADYETPGSQCFANTILPFVMKSNIILLANHGTVSYDAELERAFWLTEILDGYCRALILARQLGTVTPLSAEKIRALQELRVVWGLTVKPG